MLAPETSGSWHPATVGEVLRTVERDLGDCTVEEAEAFRRYSIEAHEASLTRYGKQEHVIVVARKDEEVMYWEDVDEGFNISPTASDGSISHHYCNQDSIAQAIRRWI